MNTIEEHTKALYDALEPKYSVRDRLHMAFNWHDKNRELLVVAQYIITYAMGTALIYIALKQPIEPTRYHTKPDRSKQGVVERILTQPIGEWIYGPDWQEKKK